MKLPVRLLFLFLLPITAIGQDTLKQVEVKDPDGQVTEINFFADGDSRPVRRTVLRPKYGEAATYQISYTSPNQNDLTIQSLIVIPPEGKALELDFANGPWNHETPYSEKKPAALIIDSGFFPAHPLLHGKHFSDPATVRGTLGAGGSVRYSFNDNEVVKLPPSGGPLSHGTFVASVAFRDIHHTSFIGAAGDIFAAPFQYKMIELINQHGIRFTNMSFGFGDKGAGSMIDKDDHDSLVNFIRFQPNVLHVIASGNHGINFDESKFSEYPACVRSSYSVVVGGLATAEIKEEDLSLYRRSTMASYGTRCVDVMGPAENVEGAGIWPDKILASGTSVATPYVLNVLLRMHEINGDLGPRAYRELLLKTAYVPKGRPFAVRSGGIVHPRRALLATRLHSDGLAPDDAAREARRQIYDEREISDYTQLEKLWAENKLYF